MPGSLQPTTVSSTAPLKVIIIEDEEGHFQLMQRAIENELHSASIFYFEDAETCLQQIDEIHPQVVLVDYLIPGMNGLEFLAVLKKTHPEIPVVVITGHGDELIAIQALHLGAEDYLIKSGDFFKLLPGILTKVIAKRKLERSLEETARLNELLLDSLPSPALLIERDGRILAANQKAREIGARPGGLCLSELCPVKNPCDRGGLAQERAWPIEGDPFGIGCHLHKEAIPRSAEVDAFGSVWEVKSAPLDRQKHLIYATEITRRKRAEEALTITQSFLRIANQHSTFIPLLEAFVREIKNQFGCQAVGIRVLDEQGNIPYQAYLGFDRRFYESESPLSIHSDACMCINVITGMTNCTLPFYTKGGSFYMNRTTHFLANVSQAAKGTTRNVCNQYGFESVALIPIPVQDRIFGLIHLADRRQDKVPLFIVEVIERVAKQLATAVQRVKSAEALANSEKQLRMLSSRLLTAQEEERKKIANELHDSIASSIGAIKFSIENTLQTLEPTLAAHEKLRSTIRLAQETMEEVRRIMGDLRPAMLDDLGIVTTIQWFCRRFQSIYTNIRIAEQVDVIESDIPAALKVVIFRVIQEAFNNIAKYSRAERVELLFVRKGSLIELTIADNGVGFDLTAISPEIDERGARGLGLISMKERIEFSGGNFLISSNPGHGTTLQASWRVQTPIRQISGSYCS